MGSIDILAHPWSRSTSGRRTRDFCTGGDEAKHSAVGLLWLQADGLPCLLVRERQCDPFRLEDFLDGR